MPAARLVVGEARALVEVAAECYREAGRAARAAPSMARWKAAA